MLNTDFIYYKTQLNHNRLTLSASKCGSQYDTDKQNTPRPPHLGVGIKMSDMIVNTFNPSSPKGGCTNPPNGLRPGAQNRTAKG